ncbi:hypothetical protein PHLCEN_2v2266, partial [Hermanssonia centrifuga]
PCTQTKKDGHPTKPQSLNSDHQTKKERFYRAKSKFEHLWRVATPRTVHTY